MNSFTFKKAKKVQCFHDDNTHIMLVIYDHWHWSYDYNQKQLNVWFATAPVQWTKNIPVSDFSIKVQTPIYSKDHRSSIKRKPVYSREQVDWDQDAVHCVPVKIQFFSNYFNISFNESVDGLYGDDIVTIVENMRGFFAEFKEHLKVIKSFDLDTVDAILTSMNCRLCAFGINNSKPEEVRDEKIAKRYSILPVNKSVFNEETIDTDTLPF